MPLLACLLLGFGLGLPTASAQDPKIASGLLDLLRHVEAQERSGLSFSEIPLPPQFKIDAERRVQVVLSISALSPENLRTLVEHGVVIEAQEATQNLVQARIPLDQVEGVAGLPFVRLILLPSYGMPNIQGKVGTEGDAIVKADLARQSLGVDGGGIRIGVISDGLAGLSFVTANGDLPPTELIRGESGLIVETRGGVTGRSFWADETLQGPLGSPAAEGTALLEIIHDLAPGAQLFFAAISTDLEFVNALKWLAEEAGGPNPRRRTPGGVDIVVNNFAFFDIGPIDGTSAVSQAATAAVAQGVAFFTSVGNAALNHYQGPFFDPDGDTFHNFAGDDEGLQVRVGGLGSAMAVLTWNDPSEGSNNDYNLRAFDAQGNPLRAGVFGGRDPQTGTQSPRESLTILNSQFSETSVVIRIENIGGRAASRDLNLFVFGVSLPIEHNVPSGSVLSPADAKGVVSVGAVNAATPQLIEAFSSRGPTSDGRLKPELVAPDGVSTTIFGPSNFLGTSAAVPHAAAVAALLLSLNPRLSPEQLARALEVTATDLGDPGPDVVFGFGRVDALAAATLPQGDLTLNASTFRPGETLVLDIFLKAGTTLNTGDAYIVALDPTGEIVSLVLQPDESLQLVNGLVPLQLGFSTFDRDGPAFERTFTPADPLGVYTVIGALALNGRYPLDQSNWIIFDTEEFALAP
jgi:subtilisin family serine protease